MGGGHSSPMIKTAWNLVVQEALSLGTARIEKVVKSQPKTNKTKHSGDPGTAFKV